MKYHINKIFVEKTDNLTIQLLRYTFVGGFAFFADFGALIFFTEYFHLHYLLSAAISFIIGLAFNYILSVKWVFNKRSIKNRTVEFFTFLLIGIIGLAFNEVFIWFFTEEIAFHYTISKLITAIIVYLWNFFARKLILFNK